MSASPLQRTHDPRCRGSLLRAAAALALATGLGGAPAAADQWLVYVNGGLESIADKGWTERHGQLLFTQRSGTLVSVPFDDVDLPTSAVITWQLGGRHRMPPRAAPGPPAPETGGEARAPCVDARVLALHGGETLEVAAGDTREIVHLACLDAPETAHRHPQLAWFGRAALSWMQLEIKAGARVCLTEHAPPLRDGDGHRILYVRSADGRDVAGAVIAGGLAMLRPGPCSRAAEYSALEEQAIRGERGLWGARAESRALAAVSLSGAAGGGPPPPRSRSSGRRRGGG